MSGSYVWPVGPHPSSLTVFGDCVVEKHKTGDPGTIVGDGNTYEWGLNFSDTNDEDRAIFFRFVSTLQSNEEAVEILVTWLATGVTNGPGTIQTTCGFLAQQRNAKPWEEFQFGFANWDTDLDAALAEWDDAAFEDFDVFYGGSPAFQNVTCEVDGANLEPVNFSENWGGLTGSEPRTEVTGLLLQLKNYMEDSANDAARDPINQMPIALQFYRPWTAPAANINTLLYGQDSIQQRCIIQVVYEVTPIVEITSPSTDPHFQNDNELVTLTGTSDEKHGVPTDDQSAFIIWDSDIQGSLGVGDTLVNVDLDVGTHVITATSVGVDRTGTDTVTIVVGSESSLSSTTVLDADDSTILGLATGLLSTTVLDADDSTILGLATGLLSTTALDADDSTILGLATELLAATALDADDSTILGLATELLAATALDGSLDLIGIADLGNIFDAIAIAQQVDVVVKSQQADVAVRAQQADVVARVQQANVAAEPQKIDVVAGAEDGND